VAEKVGQETASSFILEIDRCIRANEQSKAPKVTRKFGRCCGESGGGRGSAKKALME